MVRNTGRLIGVVCGGAWALGKVNLAMTGTAAAGQGEGYSLCRVAEARASAAPRTGEEREANRAHPPPPAAAAAASVARDGEPWAAVRVLLPAASISAAGSEELKPVKDRSRRGPPRLLHLYPLSAELLETSSAS